MPVNELLRAQLLGMRAEDIRVRQELVDSGELGDRYIPRMEAVHVRNAERLSEIIAQHGWPDEQIAGKDGAEAAWLVIQHAIGSPDLQRRCLSMIRQAAEQGRVPGRHAAYLEDRIAMYERRPQRFGTQWLEDARDGRTRPWALADPARVDEWRAKAGLPAMHPIPEPGPELPTQQQRAIRDNQHWWEDWLTSKGWQD